MKTSFEKLLEESDAAPDEEAFREIEARINAGFDRIIAAADPVDRLKYCFECLCAMRDHAQRKGDDALAAELGEDIRGIEAQLEPLKEKCLAELRRRLFGGRA